ncbi:MAG: hypothetical protein OJF60_000698 [Burkholderiaceae bacterium]|jgi:hypothetical protein|nr:MAG: hypothetical protein OJF60_000698 [Burkholderiaceae bacterium]
MSLGWTVLGTFAQLMLAMFLCMLVIFSGASIANGGTLGGFQMRILNLSIFVLPGLCAVSAAVVIYLHLRGGSVASYWWYAMPLVAATLYLAYAIWLGRNA